MRKIAALPFLATLLMSAGSMAAGAPETAMAEWLSNHSADGKTVVLANDRTTGAPGYVCGSVDSARSVVTLVPDGKDVPDQQKAKLFKAGLAMAQCRPATGRFTPIAVHESRFIVCGEECASDWTALEAKDANGRTVGLIFDGSIM